MKIDGAAAIVTGGASGLGLATTKALTAKNAHVIVVDLPSDHAEEAVAGLGGSVTFVPADVRDESAVRNAVDHASYLGPLRVLVNCAGIGDPARMLGRSGPLDLERFRKVVEINLIGSFNVARLASAAMAATEPVEGERGVIVNTASVAAFDGQVGQSSYSASKGGIVAMTLPLARELAALQIRVMAIAPGMFETPILRGLSAEIRESLGSQIPHPSRLGNPTEYAQLVSHIVDNPMLNGEVIRLDGAIRMAPQ
jgi:NAD(P)-dependent dehydrogenase (short-subunit alcohol dehydrogenase family)